MKVNNIKTFPLRMELQFHEVIAEALTTSVIKTKHDWIMKAIQEKIERETKAV